MWPKPIGAGGSHDPNYWAGRAQILLTNIPGADAIAMIPKATATPILTAPRLMALATGWTGLRRVRFLLQGGFHAERFGLVGEQESRLPVEHLVNLLVGFRAVVEPLPDIAHIPDDEGLDPRVIQGRNKPRRGFMRDITELIGELRELSALGADELLAASRAFVLGVDQVRQLGFELILVLALAAKHATIGDRAGVAIVGHREVNFPQINPGDLLPQGVHSDLGLDIRPNGFVLLALPANDHRFWCLPWPIEHERRRLFPIRQGEDAIPMPDRARFVFNAKEPLTASGRFGLGIGLPASAPRLQRGIERLNTGISGVGMEQRRRVPAHHAGGFQPETMMPNGTPEAGRMPACTSAHIRARAGPAEESGQSLPDGRDRPC